MKRILIVLLFGFGATLLSTTCAPTIDKPKTDYSYSRLAVVRTQLLNEGSAITAEEAVFADELELKIDLNFVKVTKLSAARRSGLFPTAYATVKPLPISKGLKNKISSITLTCDKSIGGFEAGLNLISTIDGGDYELCEAGTIGKCIQWLNEGINHGDKPQIDPGRDYTIVSKPVFAGTEIEEGDYTFTFRLDYVSGATPFVVTFPTVRLK